MTVCLATICDIDDDPKVIVIGDRMITFGNIIQFEHNSPKILEVTPNCVVATAGHATIHTEIIREANIPKTTGTLLIRDIASRIKDSYDRAYKKEVEDEILKRYGFANYDAFYKTQKELSPSLSDEILNEITDFEFGLQFLIAGIDDEGAHIFKIDVDNKLLPYDALGYEGCGIGYEHARTIFFSTSYLDKCPLERALYITYKAKRVAEKAPGVGQTTDLWIIKKNANSIVIDKNTGDILTF